MIESKIASLGLASGFKLFADKIETPGDGLIIFRGMQDHTADSIKSLEGFRIAWVDEAQTLSARSLALLRPTIRAENSELWASWNPRRKSDAIDDFLRGRRPERSVVISANWRDNPWFPAVLEEERKTDLSLYPDRYDHIWEGDYVKAFEGAYFADLLAQARREGRIDKVAADPLLPLRAFIDIGGAGAAADAFTMWIVQWVGGAIKILDYYEAVGQVLAFHAEWLRSHGYQHAILYLPHDGVATNNIAVYSPDRPHVIVHADPDKSPWIDREDVCIFINNLRLVITHAVDLVRDFVEVRLTHHDANQFVSAEFQTIALDLFCRASLIGERIK